MINFKKIVFITISLLFALQVCAKQKEKIPDFSGEWESIADFCSFRAYHSYKLKQKKILLQDILMLVLLRGKEVIGGGLKAKFGMVNYS